MSFYEQTNGEGEEELTFRNSRMSATVGHMMSNHQAGPFSIALFFPNLFSSALAALISPLNLLIVEGPPATPGVKAGVAGVDAEFPLSAKAAAATSAGGGK